MASVNSRIMQFSFARGGLIKVLMGVNQNTIHFNARNAGQTTFRQNFTVSVFKIFNRQETSVWIPLVICMHQNIGDIFTID